MGYGSQSRLQLLHRVPPCCDRWRARSLHQRRHFSRTRIGSSIPKAPKALSSLVVKDYDSAMNLIVEADVLTRGLFVGNDTEDNGDRAGSSRVGAK
jgi:hypothetical protein